MLNLLPVSSLCFLHCVAVFFLCSHTPACSYGTCLSSEVIYLFFEESPSPSEDKLIEYIQLQGFPPTFDLFWC